MIKYFIIKNFGGTCSTVEMLKGYMLIFRSAEGVLGQRKVGKPWLRSCTQLLPELYRIVRATCRFVMNSNRYEHVEQ